MAKTTNLHNQPPGASRPRMLDATSGQIEAQPGLGLYLARPDHGTLCPPVGPFHVITYGGIMHKPDPDSVEGFIYSRILDYHERVAFLKTGALPKDGYNAETITALRRLIALEAQRALFKTDSIPADDLPVAYGFDDRDKFGNRYEEEA